MESIDEGNLKKLRSLQVRDGGSRRTECEEELANIYRQTYAMQDLLTSDERLLVRVESRAIVIDDVESLGLF